MSNTSIMDSLFQRTLDDLIKGIRLYSPDSTSTLSSFISKAVDEIRREIKSTDPSTKSTALLKLTYLNQFYAIDMSWASFNVVEVISSPQFSLKKIGYLAATLSFDENTEVILLVTNQLRKDLSSLNDFEVGLGLHCLSIIATPDLSRDLCNDIYVLLSSTRVYVRKKAIAVVLRVFRKYPDAVKVCFKRLVENLESSADPQAVCAVVGVFCELALVVPKAYLPLAPEFYKILLECKNNWVLIKVLKIFAKLAPLEPRLGNKIVDPICEIMRRTLAKSLLFECIRTVVGSLSNCESAVKLAVLKIKEFLSKDDPNLKYLGLQALSELAATHSWAVVENKEAVIKSLSDVDPNIKLASLRLLMAMVSEDNVAEITKVLLNYALKSDPEFCNEILRSILATCRKNYYEIVFDFDWYVLVLGDMARIPHCQTGEEIENQLVDIGMRVKEARIYCMLDTFMRLAKSNTAKNLETCGILAGVLKNRKFSITALIIPKQESTSNSCQATNEEEIFDVQDKQSLFPLGWIHTHPTQSCFMSSIDVHTHYSYQVMLPEAVAIVMAPTDRTKNHGIFRLTTPGGMSVIRHCERRGFHSHDPPTDGGPIYKQCTDVYMNPNLKFDVIDLR